VVVEALGQGWVVPVLGAVVRMIAAGCKDESEECSEAFVLGTVAAAVLRRTDVGTELEVCRPEVVLLLVGIAGVEEAGAVYIAEVNLRVGGSSAVVPVDRHASSAAIFRVMNTALLAGLQLLDLVASHPAWEA